MASALKGINLYPGFVQDQLVKNAGGTDFDNERNKGRAATWCVPRSRTGAAGPARRRDARHCQRATMRSYGRAYVFLMLTSTIILIVFNALKIGNVDFTVPRPTLTQYDAIFAGANVNGPTCDCAFSTLAVQAREERDAVVSSDVALRRASATRALVSSTLVQRSSVRARRDPPRSPPPPHPFPLPAAPPSVHPKAADVVERVVVLIIEQDLV